MSTKRILASLGIILLLSTSALAAPSFKVSKTSTTIVESITPETLEAIKKQQAEKSAIIPKTRFVLSKVQDADVVAFVQAFPDAENLEINSDNVTSIAPVAALKKLSRFSSNIRSVKDLTPLADLTSLRLLTVSYNAEGQNLKWMSKLNDLRTISLTARGLTSLEGLPTQTKLSSLTLDYINVPNLEIVAAAFPKLITINLKYSTIGDISALAKIPSLSDVNLYGATVKDFSPLAKLPSIKRLMYYAVKGADFSTLGTLKQTKRFWGGLTELKSIDWMKDMPALERIDFFSEYVSDYTPLKNAPNLNALHIWNMRAPVGDLAFLKPLKKLKYLRIEGNKGITNFEAIGELSNLEDLFILRNNDKDNPVTNYAFLQKMPNLKSINLSRKTAENFDVHGLQQLSSIDLLSMNKDKAPLDLSFVKDLPKLSSLKVIDCTVVNFEKIDNLPAIKSISILKAKGITDLAFLAKFPTLKELIVSKNNGFTDAQLATVPKGVRISKR